MGQNSTVGRARPGGAAAALRTAIVAWLAIVGLVAQLGASVACPAMAPRTSEAAALGALKALLGPNVALCAHAGGAPGAPAQDHRCCNDCALCHGLAHAALAPAARAIAFLMSARPLTLAAAAVIFSDARVAAAAQPRGPPALA
jgi:hypothetical protein